jgi:hypothetical protein
LFAEIQDVLDPADEINIAYYRQDDHVVLEILLRSAQAQVLGIVDKMNQQVKRTEMLTGFALCHQILIWHGASFKAKDILAQGVLIELEFPFVK